MEYFLAPFQALEYLKEHKKLWRFVAWPLGITTVVMLLSLRFIYTWGKDTIFGFLGIESVWAAVILFIGTVGLLFISFYVFVFFLNMVSGPFNEILSEKIEDYEDGELDSGSGFGKKFNLKNLGREYLHTITTEVTRLVIFAVVSFVVFMVSLASAGVFFALLNGGVALFFMVFEFVDYTLGRKNYSFGTKVKFIFKNAGPFALYGLGLWVFLMIPILNFLFIPVAVVSATRLSLKFLPKK